jgi:hypothetical protein
MTNDPAPKRQRRIILLFAGLILGLMVLIFVGMNAHYAANAPNNQTSNETASEARSGPNSIGLEGNRTTEK